MIRAWTRRLTLSVAVAFTAGTGALVAAPLHAFAAQSLTLTTSSTTAVSGSPVTLTATASPTPSSNYDIEIDSTTGDYVTDCFDSNPCAGQAVYPSASTHSFQATVTDTDTGTVLATSNTVTVTWSGPTPAYTVTLTSSTTTAQSGEDVTFTATASPNIPTGYTIDIYEDPGGTNLNVCYTQPCTGDAIHDSGTFTYRAYLDNDPNVEDPPCCQLASSTTVTVTWLPPVFPSETFCNPPAAPPVAFGAEGVDALLSVRAGLGDVCFRVSVGSTAIGGALVITPGTVPGIPHFAATDLCAPVQNDGTNTIPGSHPILEVTSPAEVRLDAYSGSDSSGALWVCVTAGTTSETVIIPISLGTLPNVTFQPDPDSIVQ